jgi:hypothetical protein
LQRLLVDLRQLSRALAGGGVADVDDLRSQLVEFTRVFY